MLLEHSPTKWTSFPALILSEVLPEQSRYRVLLLGPPSQGARLFAAITGDTGFDRIVITSLSGNTLGFLVAQIRYQACVELCNVLIKDTAEKGTTIPVTCCISVPGFEVVSVSNDITARILSTCCEVQEDFCLPEYRSYCRRENSRRQNLR